MASDDDKNFADACGSWATWLIAVGIIVAFGFSLAYAQDHKHPPQDQAAHDRFYKNWMMPDNRAVSCCHGEDCSPAESRFENGRWLARKIGDPGTFSPVPPQKIERDRDSPDGRSHLCGRHYSTDAGKLTVFCFIAGGGA